jgi:hypothetical protein
VALIAPGTSNVRSGSNATEMGCPSYVRFPPESDRTADIWACLKGANFGSREHYVIPGSRPDVTSVQAGGTARSAKILMIQIVP